MYKDSVIQCQRVIEDHIGLVKKIIQRFNVNEFDRDDLMQAGLMGLWKAAYHFNEKKGFAFSTFATPYILGEVRDELRKNRLVKVSRNYYKIINHLLKSEKIDENEIMNQVGCDYYDIVIAYNLMNNVALVEDETVFVSEEQRELPKITRLEEFVLDLFYKNGFKQKEIAKRVGISQSSVSRIINKYKI